MRLSILATVFSAASVIAVPTFGLNGRGSTQSPVAVAQSKIESLNIILVGHQKNVQSAVASVAFSSSAADKKTAAQQVTSEMNAMTAAVTNTVNTIASKGKPITAQSGSTAGLIKALASTSSIMSDTASTAKAADPISGLIGALLNEFVGYVRGIQFLIAIITGTYQFPE